MKVDALDTASAQAAFQSMPLSQQAVTLSPAFARADAARDEQLRCVHLAVRDGARLWLNSIHLRALKPDPSRWGAISPYGYGGPVCTTDDPAFIDDAWRAYGRWCADNGVLAEFARFHPAAANHRFFGGAVSENRQTVSVDLQAVDLAAQYSTLARRKLRRAQAAGARAQFSREAADWARFGPFYRDAMAAMNAAAWYHFGDAYFEALRSLEPAWLCICESNGAWLSAGVYLFGRQVAEYHLGANSPAGYEAGTPHLMQHAAAERARGLGAHSLYLGGGTSPEPDNPLLFHKLGFSRQVLPFFVGQAIHDEPAYWAVAARAGFDRAHPPARILID